MNKIKYSELPVIQGEKVTLRPINYTDTHNIVSWRNSTAVRNNFIFREKFTDEMHINWMKNKVETGEVIQYIIEDMNKKPIGSVYYRDIDTTNECAEYGIFIGDDSARGMGYGTEAAELFVEFGFSNLQLHRVYLRVLSDNNPAISSYKKAGFRIEGYVQDMVKIEGKFIDIIFMSRINS